MAIPRIIHQTFESWDSLPQLLQENCLHISTLNRDYEYRFYEEKDRSRFILEHYGQEVLKLFSRINPFYGAARADLFRCLCVYRHGGIYLDLKTKVERPFSSVLRDQDVYILGQWQTCKSGDPKQQWGIWPELTRRGIDGEFQNWHLAAQAGHPFLEAVISAILSRIRYYSPFQYSTSQEAIIHTTGPVAYTLAIAPILHKHPHRLLRTEDLGLSYSIFTNVHSHRRLYPSYANRVQPVVFCNSLVSKLTYFHYLHHQDRRAIPRAYDLAIQALEIGYRARASFFGSYEATLQLATKRTWALP